MSDLCAEDMARIQMDDLITTDSSIVDTAGSSSESHRMTSSGAMELGRRLLASARDGDCATVLQLLAGGAPFTTDWLGTSPLHLAASNNQVAVCEVLLQAGVSRDCRTKVSRTPLHLAAYWGHERVCTLLLDHGADVNCRDMLGMTPLHWAAERGHALACSVLLSRGAERHAVSRFHTTPAGLAEDAGGEVARILAEQGEDEEKQDEEEANMATEFITLDDEREEVDMETIAPEATLQEHKDNAVPTSAASEAPGAALLLRHGITLLPADEGGTVLRALQHGRTVLLSDAGKRMLKESSAAPAPAPAPALAPAPGKQPGGGGGGVVLTATPVKAPPPPSAGVKIFTLGNNMLKLGKDKPLTLKRVTEPTTTQYLTLPAGARLVSGSGRGRGQGQGQGHGQGGKRARTEPVKILVNKAGLGRLVGKGDLVRVSREQESGASAAAASAACPENVVRVPEQFLRSKDAEYLRAQLLAATAALHRARMKLKRQ